MTKLRTAAMAAVCLLVAVAVVDASVTPVWSIDGLAALSRAVVTGRVVDVSVGRDPATDAIYTYVTVSVADVLKGDIPERSIVVKQLGGQLGADGLMIVDQAAFTIGEDVLLFLEARPRDGTQYTAALWQGKWTIEADATQGERTIARYRPEAADRGAFRGDPERLTLALTSNRVRELSLAAGAPAVRTFRTSPPADEIAAASHPPGTLHPSYVLFSPGFRWNEFDTNTAIGVDVMAGGQAGLAGGGASEVTRAFNLWMAATPLSFFGAASSNRCFGQGNSSDGHISIVFMDPCGEVDDSGGTLAAAVVCGEFPSSTTDEGAALRSQARQTAVSLLFSWTAH